MDKPSRHFDIMLEERMKKAYATLMLSLCQYMRHNYTDALVSTISDYLSIPEEYGFREKVLHYYDGLTHSNRDEIVGFLADMVSIHKDEVMEMYTDAVEAFKEGIKSAVSEGTIPNVGRN